MAIAGSAANTSKPTHRKAAGSKTALEQFGAIEMPDLTYTDAIAKATAPLYEKVRHHIPEIEWPVHAPYVYWINKLKKKRKARPTG